MQSVRSGAAAIYIWQTVITRNFKIDQRNKLVGADLKYYQDITYYTGTCLF